MASGKWYSVRNILKKEVWCSGEGIRPMWACVESRAAQASSCFPIPSCPQTWHSIITQWLWCSRVLSLPLYYKLKMVLRFLEQCKIIKPPHTMQQRLYLYLYLSIDRLIDHVCVQILKYLSEGGLCRRDTPSICFCSDVHMWANHNDDQHTTLDWFHPPGVNVACLFTRL